MAAIRAIEEAGRSNADALSGGAGTACDSPFSADATDAVLAFDPDAAAHEFGRMLGRLFAHNQGFWAETMEELGRGLGRFIYLMDAYDDLEKDSRRGQFNALQQLADELPPAAYEQRCHELLTQQMGRCAQQFEMLPILKDTPEGKLLYNTIYSGVWSKYARVRKHREAKRHD